MRYSDFKIVEAKLDEIPDDGFGAAQDNGYLDRRNIRAMLGMDDDGNVSRGLEQGPPYPPEDAEIVNAMQRQLEHLGYSVGTTGQDGKYGPRTARAVRAFKQDNNLGTDGMTMSAEDIEALLSATRVPNPTSTGNETGGAGRGSVELPNPDGDGGSGQLRLNRGMSPLLDLSGGQSSMTQSDADTEMQETLRMAREMAGIFGKPLTINDAIAKRGTSRESSTPGSQHFHGTALDLDTSGYSDEEKLQLVNAALQAGFSGFGFGVNILHVDRGTRRHWAYGNSSYGGVRVADLGRTVRNYSPFPGMDRGASTGIA